MSRSVEIALLDVLDFILLPCLCLCLSLTFFLSVFFFIFYFFFCWIENILSASEYTEKKEYTFIQNEWFAYEKRTLKVLLIGLAHAHYVIQIQILRLPMELYSKKPWYLQKTMRTRSRIKKNRLKERRKRN